jgi:hypothetical protein
MADVKSEPPSLKLWRRKMVKNFKIGERITRQPFAFALYPFTSNINLSPLTFYLSPHHMAYLYKNSDAVGGYHNGVHHQKPVQFGFIKLLNCTGDQQK